MNKYNSINAAALSALLGGEMDNFITASTEGGIEAQEAAGQVEFVQSQNLPKECPKEDLESLGFIFGEDADDIFISAQFPEGWEIVPTEHSMWSGLLDSQGRKRGSIFYKAAFYDRSAHMYLNKRYSVRRNFDLEDCKLQFQVFDCDEAIFNTDIKSEVKYSDGYWTAEDKLRLVADKYLSENYSDHENCNAYWELEK